MQTDRENVVTLLSEGAAVDNLTNLSIFIYLLK